jgi:chemosensory pili system protein ChpA (sensor histidine kinase/response regulator)
MLGLGSIQKTSHRLEDFFKILKETPGIRPDQKLESLLLQVFDTLQELIEQLQGPFGLTEEAANATMAGVEPVFEELKQHMTVLEGQSGTAITANLTGESVPVPQPVNASQDSALLLIFQNDVPAQLREMLQLFRQAEALSDGRDRLQEVCRSLKGLGEAFDLTQWCELVEMASRAIADPDNSYRALAPVVIKDLKQAQEIILAGRVADIVPSEPLQALAPAEVLPDLAVDSELVDFFAIADDPEPTEPLDLSEFELATPEPGLDSLELNDLELSDLDFETALFESENQLTPENERVGALDLEEMSAKAERNGPEVGMAELNSLADLFEGEMPDLGSTWQQEEVINPTSSSNSSLDGLFDAEDSNDFSDLLLEEADSPVSASSPNDFNNLFESDLTGTSSSAVGSEVDDFGLPDFDANLSELLSEPTEASAPDLTISSLDPFADLNLEELGDVDSEPADNLFDRNPQESNASLDDLGELFDGLDSADLSFTQFPTASTNMGSSESPFAEFDFDASLENTTASESVAGAWGDLDLNESLFSMPESEQAQNGSGDLSEAALFDLTDLSDPTLDPLSTTARSSDNVLPGIEELSDPWGELEASTNSSSSNLEANFNFDLSDLNSSEDSLELPDDLFAEASTGEESIQIDAEDPFGFETSLDDQRFDALFDNENELDTPELGETLEATSEIESSPTSITEESSELSDDPFNFASTAQTDDQTDLDDLLGTDSNDLDLELGSLENDFLNLGETEENLDSLLAGSISIGEETSSNVNSALGEMAGLFEPEASLDLDLNETADDELDDLFGEPSETLDLPSEDADLSLAFEEMDIVASQSDPVSEAIIPSANPGDFDLNFGDNETSADLDSLLNFDTEDDLLNDPLLSSDAADGLGDLLGSDPIENSEFDALSNEDLTLELGETPTSSESELNLEDELFGFSTPEENPALDLDNAFLSSGTTDDLDDLLGSDLMQPSEFDALSSEDLTLELGETPTSSESELNLEDELFGLSTSEENPALDLDNVFLSSGTTDDLDDLLGSDLMQPSEFDALSSEDLTLELGETPTSSETALNLEDELFGFSTSEESPALDLDNVFLSSGTTDDLDDLLGSDPIENSEFDALSNEDLTLELGETPTSSEAVLNLEDELFGLSTPEESPALDLDNAFLSSGTTDDLDDLLSSDLMQPSEFDALSSEDLTLELGETPTSSETALNLEDELFGFSAPEETPSDTLNGFAPQVPEETATDESLDFLLNDSLDLEGSSPGNENAQSVTDDRLDILNFDGIGESEPTISSSYPPEVTPSESDFDLSFADLDAPTPDASVESLLDDLDLDFGEAENLTQTPADSESAFDFGFTDSPSDDDDFLNGPDLDLPEITSSDAAPDFDLAFSDLEVVDELDNLSEVDPSDSSESSGFDPLLGAGIAAASLGVGMVAASRADDRSTVENVTETEDDDLDFLFDTESPEIIDSTPELDDLEALLGLDSTSSVTKADEFSDLDALFSEDLTETPAAASHSSSLLDEPTLNEPTDQAASDEFNDLDDLLDEETNDFQPVTFDENFDDLESLLADAPEATPQSAFSSEDADTEFDDLEKMLEDADKTMGGSPSVKNLGITQQGRRTNRPGKVFSEQTMRVPVKHLDNLSNLVGELVVNRNSLEQDQERLRQSLDNLLYQVQQLSDVGQRMQDLYERSLLESSLLASRQHHRTPTNLGSLARDNHSTSTSSNPVEYDPLEMDRFTGFHSLSQEMIELIVRVRESASDIEFIVDETDQVTRMFRQVTTQLQEGLTRSRMVPFAQTADRMPRAVRDIAMKCGKQAELVIEGRDTLIDKMILEHLYDPMTHLVNNAITHGIETPDVRRATGKSAIGRITIRAFHQGNQTVISVSDDGAGVDVDRVKTKAIEKGLITPAEARTMSRLDIYDLLFHPGFTTKDQADDFSGRGVGMDVVRTSLSEIRGAITTDSASTRGTTFTIRLPLTLSISKALCCISDRARIAFPMDGVEDMLDIPKERIQTNADGQACLLWRDSLLPLRPLTELLGYNRHLSRGNVYGGNQEDDMVSVVVLRSAGNFLALQVDQVLGEQEIVIKQLEGPVPKPVGVAGATVLGDGRIMPIADVLELIDLSMGRIRRDVGTMWDQGTTHPNETLIVKTEPTVLIVDDSITVRELLSMTFNKVGYRVEQARDGQEAWEKLRAGLPCDIVFCDIEMPRMDGLELLSRIQKDPNLSDLPIAMLTSRGADRHRQMAASLGASGYFTKPYLEEALLDAAQRMLKGEVLIVGSGG